MALPPPLHDVRAPQAVGLAAGYTSGGSGTGRQTNRHVDAANSRATPVTATT